MRWRGLLLLVTPSRRGEERADLEEAITGGRFPYEPHARGTADLRDEVPEPAEEGDGPSEEQDR
ncbi:MAG: hypothetical protein KQH83_05395 [Actinobacteria bacterium]|nr:hypothetical protein [Actinomycetota bacterium]